MGIIAFEVIAGGGNGGDGSTALEARISEPFAVEFDAAGNMYVPEMSAHRIRKIDADGRVTTLAGVGVAGSFGDGGQSRLALVNGVHEVRLRPGTSELYIADTWNHRVRKIDLETTIISTVVGTGNKGYSGDGGPATAAEIGEAYAIAFDAQGTRMYLADLDNFRVRMVDLDSGIISTVAGNGTKAVPREEGMACEEPLMSPRAVAVDRAGNLYIVERGGYAIRRVDAAGRITTIVGTGEEGYEGDRGSGLRCKINGPKHAAVDPRGDLVFTDTENNVIRRYCVSSGRVKHVAGTGKPEAGLTGLNRPHGVWFDVKGRLVIADSYNDRIVRLA